MKPTQHLAKSKEFLDCAILLRESFKAPGGKSRVGYLSGYCIMVHLSLEHLLKSLLNKKVISHDLEVLYSLAISRNQDINDVKLKTAIDEINSYGYPVTGSERYPEVGFKSFKLDDELIATIEKYQGVAKNYIL
jgi:hypothetical protein